MIGKVGENIHIGENIHVALGGTGRGRVSLWSLGVVYVASLLRDNVAASVFGQVSPGKAIGTH